MPLAAVIFDFDGVLADSEPVHLRVFQTVLDSIGITLTAEEYYEQYLEVLPNGPEAAVARQALQRLQQ